MTFWGHNVLLHNNGDGTFTDVTKKAGLWHDDVRWSTGCAFVDYDRDGHLDFLFPITSISTSLILHPRAERFLPMEGHSRHVRPDGTERAPEELYKNNGDGTFTDVSEKSGVAKAGPRITASQF